MKAKTSVGNTTKTCKCNSNTACNFCEKAGHCVHECYTMIHVKKQRKERQTTGCTSQAKDKQNMNKASVDSVDLHEKPTTNGTSPSDKMEHADKASPTANPERPDDNADYGWNAVTGASSHMTLHWHWIRDYQVEQIPIKLADNTVIYSEGVRSVLFEPWINGRMGRTVELHQVLHVLKIQNNLLSIIHLT